MDGETKTGKDSLQDAGRTSPDVGASPSTEQPPKTYTETEVAKRHSKLDKTIIQLTTERDTLKQDLEANRQSLDELRRRIDEADEEEAKGSPDSLRLYQRQKQLRDLETKLKDKERQLERDRTEHAAELSAAKESKAEMAIISAAVEHHIDIGKLKEKVQKLGLTTEEQISEIAETLAGQVQPGDNGKKKIPQGDSGRTTGGGEDLDSLSPREKIEAGIKKLKEK